MSARYVDADTALAPWVTHHRAAPTAWTFTMAPVRELLERYVGPGRGWVDPFAGKHSPAQYTNDLDLSTPTLYHLDAEEFLDLIVEQGPFAGVLFDPPYSYRQISEHYKAAGRKVTPLDTSANYYNRAMNAICDHVRPGGYAISFGWNSNGFGANRGFEPVEYLMIAHGGHHNDTLVVVERKRA